MNSWTFSSIDKYETCPRQYYHLRVKRDIVEPPTEATKWGEKVHTAMEYRVRDGVELPEGMTQWEGLAAKIAAIPGEKLCEQKMSLDKNFQPVEWSAAWTRGIADLLVVSGTTAVCLDYKTGKRKLTDQLALYAGYTFAHYPQVNTVTTGFVWMKDRKIDKEAFTRVEVPMIWRKFLPKVHKLELAYEKDKWLPRPSGLCRGWCPVKHCEFYKEKV
jgi:CRISPR/Cas system-associated exonuclease Cas4 (RecB family)